MSQKKSAKALPSSEELFKNIYRNAMKPYMKEALNKYADKKCLFILDELEPFQLEEIELRLFYNKLVRYSELSEEGYLPEEEFFDLFCKEKTLKLKFGEKEKPYTVNGKQWWNTWGYNYKPGDPINLPDNLTIDEIKFMLGEIESQIPSKLPKEIVSSDFPPSNISIDTHGNMIIEMALAGYNPKDLNISISDDSFLEIELGKSFLLETTYIQKGIKIPENHICKFFIDKSILDPNRLDVSSQYGLLKIMIPRHDFSGGKIVIKEVA